MNLRRGRARRPDDWPSSHVRARAALSDRLDGAIEPDEATWLESHLDSCRDCRSVAADFAAQRSGLRALRDHQPQPPRDLWARTAAAIEADRQFGRSQRRSTSSSTRLVVPSAVLAAALVVAVAVGTLTSSQRFGSDGTTGSPEVAAASDGSGPAAASVRAGATPMIVAQKLEYLERDPNGEYSITTRPVDKVCPEGSPQPCDSAEPVEKAPTKVDQTVSSVFVDDRNSRLIVTGTSGTVSVVAIESAEPSAAAPSPSPNERSTAPSAAAITAAPSSTPTPTPTRTPTPTPTPTPVASATPGSPSPSIEPTATPSEPSLESASPSVAVTPTPSGSLDIAHDVVLVGQSAAYSKSGGWFAFTARPVNGSVGPDIYLWRVGDAVAKPVTTDHRSVFGSWDGDTVAGSTVTDATDADTGAAKLLSSTFLLNPGTSPALPVVRARNMWRPAVQPNGARAVYWTGTLRATADPGFAPAAGRLVLGDWQSGAAADAASPGPAVAGDDRSAPRHETTIAAGQMDDWDARWDSSGTHLAVWIADSQDPTAGRLSLYTVDPSDGRIDLKKPLLDAARATAGYAISDGKLVWAEPGPDSAATGKIQLLAWTADGVGTVETVTGPAIVIR